jgi:hypothetical protein
MGWLAARFARRWSKGVTGVPSGSEQGSRANSFPERE